jgi:Flp pilus assembly protein TadB
VNGPLEWIAALGTMLAAGLIAADLGRRATGWGFVLFCAVSAIWIVSGLTTGATPIAAMNAVLLPINAWGVWSYLLSARNRRVMERLAPVQERIEREVEAGVEAGRDTTAR